MLALEEIIVEINEDLSIWASVSVGFDDNGNLVLLMANGDCEHPVNNHETWAVVCKEDAYLFAGKIGITLTELPKMLSDRFRVPYGLYTPSEARSLFGDILAFFLDSGVRYNLSE